MRSQKLTTVILIGMVLGIVVGYLCHILWPDPNTAKSIADHMPKSVVEAMANNEILQIVVFSLFFGVACAALGEKAKLLVEGIDQLSHAILRVTGYVMALAPLAVFASMAAIITTQGLGILVTYGTF